MQRIHFNVLNNIVFYCCLLLQWMVVGHRGLCGLTAQWLVVMECKLEPTPASTPRLGTMALTVLGQREKHKTVTFSPVLVCLSCIYNSQSMLPQLMFTVIIDCIVHRWSLPLVSMVIMFPKLWRRVIVTTQNVSVRHIRRCSMLSWDRGREKQTGDSAVLQTALSK